MNRRSHLWYTCAGSTHERAETVSDTDAHCTLCGYKHAGRSRECVKTASDASDNKPTFITHFMKAGLMRLVRVDLN